MKLIDILLDEIYLITNDGKEVIVKDPKEVEKYKKGENAVGLNDDGNEVEVSKESTDHIIAEEKATCCGRCGRVHKKSSGCSKPYLKKSDPNHCQNKNNENIEEGPVKNAIAGATLLAALIGAGVSDAQAQSTVDKLAAKGEIEMVSNQLPSFESEKDLVNHIAQHFENFTNKTYTVNVGGNEYKMITASSKDMQMAINKATPPGQKPKYRNAVKTTKGYYVGIVLL